MRHLFKIRSINEAIKDRIIGDIKDLSEQQKEDYCKLVKFSNFYSNNYIEYKSNGDKNKTLPWNTLMKLNYT